MEHPLVQILVVVANIQRKTLKAEVEKVSMSTTIEHGSVDPKEMFKCLNQSWFGFISVRLARISERECVNIPQPGRREMKRQRSDDPGNRVRRPRMTQSSLFEGLVDP